MSPFFQRGRAKRRGSKEVPVIVRYEAISFSNLIRLFMKKFIFLSLFVVCISCETYDHTQSLGSLLIIANVDVCEFWLFNESEEQIAHAIYDKQETLFFNISMKEKGTFTIHAEYRKSSINQFITYDGGIYEYCIAFNY